MKKFLILIIAISAIFMMSCDEETTSNDDNNECTESSARCTDDKKGFILCPNENPVTVDDCLDGKVCVGEGATVKCELPVTTCTENDLRCSTDKKQIEKCDANGDWQYNLDCTGLMLCTGTGNDLTCEEPSTCVENSTRCADNKNIETCDSSGNWNSTECLTDTECVEDDGAAKCETPLCSDDDNKCTDDNTGIITCPGDGMETIEDCLDGKVCVGEGADTRCELPAERPTLEEIESTSMMMSACGLDDTISNLNEDIYMLMNIANIDDDSLLGKGFGIIPVAEFQEILQKLVDCNKNSSNCTELASCLNVEITNDDCTPKAFTNSCEGNKAVTCNWLGKILKETCETGTTCTVDTDDNDVDCYKEEVPDCDVGTFVSSCNGNIINTCEWGTEKTFDCGSEKTCKMVTEDGSDIAVCEPNANLTDCDEDTYENSCDGKYSVNCYRGKIVKNDCEEISGNGFICKENPGFLDVFFFGGCTYNEVATPCNSFPSCDGDTVKYCVNGAEKTYSCTDGGYVACSTETVEVEDDMGNISNQDMGLCTF